jgi:hypothetical protein
MVGLTHLQHLQLPQPLLHQLLYLPRIRDRAVLPKCIPCSPLRIFSEIVRSELSRCAQETSVERAYFVGRGIGHARRSRSIAVMRSRVVEVLAAVMSFWRFL